MRRSTKTTKKSNSNQWKVELFQLQKDWENAKRKLEKEIKTEKNPKEKTKLELYKDFFINHSVDEEGNIKEKKTEKETNGIYCGFSEIK